MRRTTFLAFPLVAALLAIVLAGPSPVAEASGDWRDVKKQFQDLFKTKQPLADRQKAVKLVEGSGDSRGIALLLKALNKQEKHAEDMREEWQEQEQEWREKSDRIEKLWLEKVARANERGDPSVSYDPNSEEARWLGLGKDPPHGQMHEEKARLQQLYRRILDEEEFMTDILRSVAKILNGLEGDDYEKEVKKASRAAKRASDRLKPSYIRMLGYVKGNEVTETLEEIADRSTDPKLTMLALESIGRQNTDRGLEILGTYLQHEQWPIRSAAAQGLAFYRDARAMDLLLEQAAKEEGAVRRRIFSAMATIVGEQVKGTIEAWKSWWADNKEEWIERWKRMPNDGPVQTDPPIIAVAAEEEGESLSFYGIRTDSKHIIFVVDISGSMNPTLNKEVEWPEGEPLPIDVARRELISAIKTLSAHDEDERGAASFNIVLFETKVLPYKEGKMVTATMRNKERAFEWIEEEVQADGYTNIFDGLEQAFNMISGTSDKKNMDKGADTIFLLSDGAPNRGKFWEPELILAEIKRMNADRKIAIHTIGIGRGHHRGFMQQLAAENYGKYVSRD